MTGTNEAKIGEIWDEAAAGESQSARSGVGFPLLLFAPAIAIALLLGYMAIEEWQNYKDIRRAFREQLAARQQTDNLIYYNEVLTGSARLAAATGDPQHEARHKQYEPRLSDSLQQLGELLPQSKTLRELDAANKKSLQMDKQVFEMVRQGRPKDAAELLSSEQYQANKRLCANYIREIAELVKDHTTAGQNALLGQTTRHSILVTASMLALVAIWPCLLLRIHRHIAWQRQAEQSIRQINRQLQRSIERANQMAKKAEAASHAKSDFLASMSYEIRTPLNAIVGFTEVLADENLPPEQKEYVEIIRQSAETLLTTIDDILDLSNIEAGKFKIEIADCSLTRLLSSVESILRPQAEQKGLQFQVNTNPELPSRIPTDSRRLRQCLLNLVGNAIRFTDEGHVFINVNLEKDGQRAFVRFDVEDTGIGIPPQQQQDIFNAFARAHKDRPCTPGRAGLGLAITKQLVSLLGGRLSLTSRPGEGSVFSLVVPAGDRTGSLHAAPSAADKRPRKVHQPGQAEMTFNGRVLVAEDTPTNQILTKLLLERMGFQVSLVKDGAEAVQKASTEQFDLIFMDIHMPQMDGYKATRLLREKGLETPIVALTADAMVGNDRKCIVAGCTDYIAKPIDRAQLLAVVRKYFKPERPARPHQPQP